MSYQILKKNEIETNDYLDEFKEDVLLGLSRTPKKIPSKWIYDDEGSRLFEKIMELPEYYLTDSEINSIEKNKHLISEFLKDNSFNLVELGAGNGLKTGILIEHFLLNSFDFDFCPIDISEGAMKSLTEGMEDKFEDLKIYGLVGDYFDALKWLSGKKDKTNFVLFLGSSIGNFGFTEARNFMRSLWNSLNDGDLVLVGFDLKKEIGLMEMAYNDSQGITAEFNLNLLKRINRELGGNFEVADFVHYESYDVYSGAMESYLVSEKKQTVFISEIGKEFYFEEWEPIHTEYSYKYLVSDIKQLSQDTGFEVVENYYDSKGWFVDSLWKVKKGLFRQ